MTGTERPAPTRSRVAWRLAGSLFAVVMLGYGTANAVGALAHDTWRVHRVIAQPVRVVDVDTHGGSITVVGGSASAGDGITVDMTVSRGLETPSHSETVVGDRLVLRSHCGWFVEAFCQVDYVLHVPEDTSIVARSDGGDVTVSNVRGDLDLSSSGGDLDVRDVEAERARFESDGGDVTVDGLSAASIEASSDGGDVTLVLDAPPTTVDASSDGGDVEIALPDTPDAYRVDASSDGGGATTNVRTDPTSDRIITASSDGGDVIVRYRTR